MRRSRVDKNEIKSRNLMDNGGRETRWKERRRRDKKGKEMRGEIRTRKEEQEEK